MVEAGCRARVFKLLVAAGLAASAGLATAQTGPVAAMYGEDQKRDKTLAASFATTDLPPTTGAAFPLKVYLTVGDLERAFDRPEFRSDGAIVPSNTDLDMTATSPTTQRVLVDRVGKHADVMTDLQDQIATRRKQASGAAAVLQIGVDSFVAHLPRGGAGKSVGAFPRVVCLVATDFATGGAIDRRELFAQDRVRKGIAGCFSALDAAGVRSVVIPLMGAASSATQANDAVFEGQRVLKECRLVNSVAGIALGIRDFAPGRRSLREIGIVQWDQEITGMFTVPAGSRVAQSAEAAYRTYADQVKLAFRKGLAGERTTSSDIDGSCNAIFNVP